MEKNKRKFFGVGKRGKKKRKKKREGKKETKKKKAERLSVEKKNFILCLQCVYMDISMCRIKSSYVKN